MRSTITFILTSALLVLGAETGSAQTPIRELQRTSSMTIVGEIRSVVGNEFILDDGTGQIIVSAGPRWYHQINLLQGEHVTVVGEYDDYDFDAFWITRSNGDVIYIREPSGPPPWADGYDE